MRLKKLVPLAGCLRSAIIVAPVLIRYEGSSIYEKRDTENCLRLLVLFSDTFTKPVGHFALNFRVKISRGCNVLKTNYCC